MTEGGDRDQAMGPDPWQGAGVRPLPSPSSPGTHLSFLPSGGDFFEDAVGLRPSLDSLHRRIPKEGRDALSEPGPSIPRCDLVSRILPAHLHTPSPDKSSPSPTSPQAAGKASPRLAVPGRAWREARCALWQVRLRDGVGRVAPGGGGTRAGLAGLPRDRESGAGSDEHCPKQPSPRE